MQTVSVYPRLNEVTGQSIPYPDADGVLVTGQGATVAVSKYIRDAIGAGFLLTWDPFGIYEPVDRTPQDGGSGVGDATIYVVPELRQLGVVGNGTTDEVAALTALLDDKIDATGGTISFQGPYRYRFASDFTFPDKVTVRLLNGAVLVPDDGVTVTISGPIEAGNYKIFDCDNGTVVTSYVRLYNKEIKPEWFGAKADNSTDCKLAIQAAFDGLKGGSGTLDFSQIGTYLVSGEIDLVADLGDPSTQHYNIGIKGRGFGTQIKHSQTFNSIQGEGGLFVIYGYWDGTSYNNELAALNTNVEISDIRISGHSVNDRVEIVRMTRVNRFKASNCKIDTNALEGFITADTMTCNHFECDSCEAEFIGGLFNVSPYNCNAMRAIITNCVARDCGVGIEHTGPRVTASGNILERITSNAFQMCSSSYTNESCVVANNIIRSAGSGIVVADQTHSIGRVVIDSNVLTDCNSAINVGSCVNGTVVVANNFMSGGNPANSAMIIGAGQHVIRGNTIAQSAGSGTCGIEASFLNRIRVDTNLPLAPGVKITVVGLPGERTITRTQFGIPYSAFYFDGAPASGPIALGTSFTYRTVEWGNGIYCQSDDAHLIEDNVFRGVAWGNAFLMSGFSAVLRDNKFINQTANAVIYALPALGGTFLARDDYEYAKPFIYASSEKSEIWCAGNPSKLNWKPGDVANEASPTAGGNIGRVCTVAGTAGTLNSGLCTGSTTNGSTTVTVNSLVGLHIGAYISIAGVSGTKRVMEWLSGTTIRIDIAAGATVAGAAVSYVNPTWKTFGAISA